jgi:hypothetical protein
MQVVTLRRRPCRGNPAVSINLLSRFNLALVSATYCWRIVLDRDAPSL